MAVAFPTSALAWVGEDEAHVLGKERPYFIGEVVDFEFYFVLLGVEVIIYA